MDIPKCLEVYEKKIETKSDCNAIWIRLDRLDGPMVRSNDCVGSLYDFYEGFQAEARWIGRHNVHIFKD